MADSTLRFVGPDYRWYMNVCGVVSFAAETRPNWLVRALQRRLLGITWEPYGRG